MFDFKQEVAEVLKQQIPDLEVEEIISMLEVPPNPNMGDYAFPCFKLAKTFRKAPPLIAEEIVGAVKINDYFEKVQQAGGYVNFFIHKAFFIKETLKEVLEQKECYGSSDLGKGKNVIVEFSSPNIAKPFHIGHIRSTVIGSSINRIYKFLGFNTIAINHLGDYGTQFGKLIVAFKRWGNEEEVRESPIPTLLKLYIQFHDEAEKDPNLEEEGRMWFKKLEDGDEEALKLWQWFREVSLEEFNRVYKMLDVSFDSLAGESFYSDKMPRVLQMMEDKGVLEKSQGADIVNLEAHGLPPALIRKKDGSTLYITRDLTAAIYRKETYDFYKNIYVVASQQNLHFEQWIKILEVMGFQWAEDCIHVPFGLVRLEEGTIATRKGRVVFLEDVLKKAIEKTREIILEKNPNIENIDQVVEEVGVGAIIFQELSNNRIKDYTFSWEKVLNFEGETGPYVQYTHARASSVLRKANTQIDSEVNTTLLTDDITMEVIKKIQQFSDIVQDAQRKNEPSIVTRHIIDLAQAFNRFYHDHPVLVEDEELKKARLAIVLAARQVIKIGLTLLGIKAPEKM
ncbi:arginyl-tRNA synthetase ArgS [Clostridium aceticum]|uniref:Arginine--tRNA ligase n=1 Tax=Clostridium aceticum TaxID=84022 RepID=A0A0D8ID69_9CLOT|nr:arginine--tRNA ligase [Clostridium aceticum]AKL94561.1 arginyl-tRNA synthetase ArgS [Clostridium aceticum]KJF28238.1 arginyl-tRNA synthetase [Clostridium aceticum]